MTQIFEIYNQFLGYFPGEIQGLVSLVLAGLLIIAVFKIIKKEFIYLILLVILLPASLPILNNIWDSLVNILKFLLTKK